MTRISRIFWIVGIRCLNQDLQDLQDFENKKGVTPQFQRGR